MTDPTPTLTDEQREEVVVAVLRKVVNVTNLPEWMQIPALGKPMRPLADLVADALAPLIARMVADAEARALREAAEDASECVCGHDCEWHHTERGCQFWGNGPNRCRCLRDAATAVADRLNARADRIGGGG